VGGSFTACCGDSSMLTYDSDKRQFMSLRTYQTDLLNRLRVELRSHSRVLGVLPTGGGKTRIFCKIADLARSRGADVKILVHRRELLAQTPDPYVQTIQSWVPDGEDLVIVDEAHHSCAQTWKAKLLACKSVLGFTATPQRLDGGGLDVVFQSMVEGPGISDLMGLGYLSDYKLFCPPGKPDLKGLGRSGGDYARAKLAERTSEQKVVAAAVKNWFLLAGGRQTIGFCVSVAHMQSVAESFSSAGVRVGTIDGKMAAAHRKCVVEAFRTGEIQILLSVDLISEGFDVPNCSCVLLLRPTQSLGLHLQQIGRALRPSGDVAVVLDCVGNSERHGMPDEPRTWSLNGRKKERSGLVSNLAVRVCPICFGVHKPSLRVCPYCGFAHPLDSRIPEEADILLQEKQRVTREKRRAVGRARTIEELEEIAKERGYARGWADKILQSRGIRRS